MSLSDWRERLRSDPEGTVAELVRRFGPRRSEAPEVETLYWRVLADFGRPADLARAVAGRMRVPGEVEGESAGPLLDLDREHRIRVRGRLRMAAAEVLRGVVRDDAARDRICRHSSRLPEAAFALRGRPLEAAALYALEHDHLVAEGSPVAEGSDPGAADADYRRLCRAALRYEVARSLERVERGGETAFGIMESVLGLVDRALDGAQSEAVVDWLQLSWRLSFHAREWLGFRHFENGRYREAEREFLRAAGAVPETDLALAARMFAANAMIRDGRSDEARELLDSLRIDTERLSPPIADEWLEMRERLFSQEGGNVGEAG